MSLIPAAALADLRSIAESAMIDTCTITRKSATTEVLNTTTGLYNAPTPDTIYSGPCRVRALLTGKNLAESAGAPIELRQYGATLPHTANDVAEGDVLTVTASSDGQLVGRPLYVLSVGFLSDNVQRRLMLEDRQLPNVRGS